MNTPRHACLHCTEIATFKIFLTSDPGDFNDVDNCQVYTCDIHLNMELTSNYGYVISTYESPHGFNKINGKVIDVNKVARAINAATHASVIRNRIKRGRVHSADAGLQDYYSFYGDTKGYRHLYREVTTALYNARKEVK